MNEIFIYLFPIINKQNEYRKGQKHYALKIVVNIPSLWEWVEGNVPDKKWWLLGTLRISSSNHYPFVRNKYCMIQICGAKQMLIC